jgi:hypothetical protein
VPICRAAFGALESLSCGELYFVMERRPIAGEHTPQRRVRRWAREIALAALLTIAAAAFITAAWLRGNGMPHAATPIETARKPASN